MSIPERAQHNAIVEFFDITLVRRSHWDGHTSNCKCLSQTGQGNEELTNGFCALYVWHKQLLYERELSRVTCNFLNQEVYARTLSSPSFRQLGTAGGRLINPLDRRRIGPCDRAGVGVPRSTFCLRASASWPLPCSSVLPLNHLDSYTFFRQIFHISE